MMKTINALLYSIMVATTVFFVVVAASIAIAVYWSGIFIAEFWDSLFPPAPPPPLPKKRGRVFNGVTYAKKK